MKKYLVLILLVFIAACATTPSGDYVKVYDRKSNTWSYMTKSADNPGTFVGTSATQRDRASGRYPGQHP